jgi:hypothetical protein
VRSEILVFRDELLNVSLFLSTGDVEPVQVPADLRHDEYVGRVLHLDQPDHGRTCPARDDIHFTREEWDA